MQKKKKQIIFICKNVSETTGEELLKKLVDIVKTR